MDMLVNGCATLGYIRGVNPVLRIMGVTDHDMSLVEFRKKFKDLCIILILVHRGAATVCASSERNMGAEQDHLVLFVFHQIQIRLQPFQLRTRDSSIIIPGLAACSSDKDIVHHNNMNIASVKRIIHRAEKIDIVLR